MKAIVVSLLFAVSACAQQLPKLPKPFVQSTAFNSSFKFSPDQIELGQLSPELAQDLETILNFDRSQLGNGGPSQDDFYHIHNGSGFVPPTKPGQILKVERVTDPSAWNIPAKTALSRFLYTSLSANGTLVPASAYILWPFTAKQTSTTDPSKVPVVLWSHGTSGYWADASPSAHRSLFYGNIMPFTLAQAGYAVVATDYVGLGVNTSWTGEYVPHQYQNRVASAQDSLYALRAARTAFPKQLTQRYVNVGRESS
jgi:hypothetical protein